MCWPGFAACLTDNLVASVTDRSGRDEQAVPLNGVVRWMEEETKMYALGLNGYLVMRAQQNSN